MSGDDLLMDAVQDPGRRLEVALTVMKHHRDYEPELGTPDGSWGRAIGMRGLGPDQLKERLADPGLAHEWGKFRAAILDQEARNAARLTVLCFALDVLSKSGEDGAAQRVAWIIREHYGDGVLRCADWDRRREIVRATRLMDLCPRWWREIGT